jgi:signal transduction histidine kinase
MLAGHPRSAAGTHALHRAHSGYSISNLVSEYRALRASVLRLWADAPEQAAAPEEITRFNEAIDEAIAESVSHFTAEVERWRAIFLGVLGHDLRSPLSAIVMTSELIARMAVDAPVATAAQRLIRSGERMRELLDKLLVYNRVQMGVGFEVHRVDVDLARACREEIEMLQASMPGTRIEFEAPQALRGAFDAGRVREALANLVVNAWKYGTPDGAIQIALRDAGDGAELVVRNPGVPMPRETFDLMFEPLRRGGVSGGEAERASLGLGLFSSARSRRRMAGPSGASRRTGTRFSGCTCRRQGREAWRTMRGREACSAGGSLGAARQDRRDRFLPHAQT